MEKIYLEPTYRSLMVQSVEEASHHVESYSKQDIQEVLADYMAVSHYDYALYAIIRKYEKSYPVLYRGSRFKNELLVEGAIIQFGTDMISTSLDIEIACKFAADTHLPESIYEECAEFGIVDESDDHFEEKVNSLYGNILFEIHNAKGLYLNEFFDVPNNLTKEQEVLIENREDRQYKVVSIEPYTFKIEDSEYPLTKVVVHAI